MNPPSIPVEFFAIRLGKSGAVVDSVRAMAIELADLHRCLPAGGLFGGGSWRWSPEPFLLSRAEARSISSMGHPLARFQQACDEIYRRSASGSLPAWISELLDFGKPEWIIRAQRDAKAATCLPRVIRPDLIVTDDGFALTELDSVPGGIGVTAWLSRVYSEAGYEVMGGAHGMIDGFRSLMPSGGGVLISEEAGDYRPEMEWLCAELGSCWKVLDANADVVDGNAFYRFFEWFDWQSIPSSRALAASSLDGAVQLTPPVKPHLEEKLWLALLWSPGLKAVWEQSMRGAHLQRLRELVPRAWVLDSTPLPPHAAIPWLNVHSWWEVADFSQKQRQLVLKVSGFHESAWGSRGVFIGHDLSSAEWRERLKHALDQASSQPWILQDFQEGRMVRHPVYQDDGSVVMMDGRVRLCPYFFTDEHGKTQLAGCLATIVPADKKKIHGMQDAVLVPCVMA
ncbi:MAG: hypothetical protein ACO3RV_02210 [Luteolibacter sp.]